MGEDFVVVFAGFATEGEIMRAALEAAGIDCILNGELAGSAISGGVAGAVRLMVRPADAAEARAIIEGPTVEVTGEAGD